MTKTIKLKQIKSFQVIKTRFARSPQIYLQIFSKFCRSTAPVILQVCIKIDEPSLQHFLFVTPLIACIWLGSAELFHFAIFDHAYKKLQHLTGDLYINQFEPLKCWF